MEPVEPMKKWRVRFQGDMVLAKPDPDTSAEPKVYGVNIDAEYNSDFEYFDFDSDMDPWTVSRAMSKEPWSREYFDGLKKAHQSHYEQFGFVSGTYSLDGAEPNNFKVGF